MSESWTPGPWETDRYAVRSEGPEGRQIALCEISVRGRLYDETYPEAEANARLIAAAPDLYEALETIVLEMDHGISTPAARHSARAALAKARGEA